MNEHLFSEQSPLLEVNPYTYIGRDGFTQERTDEILVEHHLQIIVNGTPASKITCLNEYLPELVYGHLLTEGYIRRADDVQSFELTCNEAIIQLSPGIERNLALQPVTPIDWKPEWIFALADKFAEGTPLHDITWATHSCILAKQDEILFSCEDLGRHNALDKVIGYALLHGIPLQECTVYSSGRVPTDMAEKAIRAGIPVFSSKASPTAAAIALAKEHHLTLICAARRDRMKVFTK